MTNALNFDTPCLIYVGGTFGSHGMPLSALPATVFLPALQALLNDKKYTSTFIPNDIVKDSSELSPQDFVSFYRLIYSAYLEGARKFILITGTDTLSHLAAFLSIGLASLPIALVITGSMQPLFDPVKQTLTLNTKSDAWQNLLGAFDFLAKNIAGMAVSFNGEMLQGDSTQKIHTSAINAFVGKTLNFDTPQKNAQSFLSFIDNWQNYTVIHTLYCLPNQADTLAWTLEQLIDAVPTAVIIQGFGAGNLPYSDKIKQTLSTLVAQNFLLIMSSTCPFGAVSTTYQSGAWQYQLGLVSGQDIPIPALYAYALWVCLTSAPEHRTKVWQNKVNGL